MYLRRFKQSRWLFLASIHWSQWHEVVYGRAMYHPLLCDWPDLTAVNCYTSSHWDLGGGGGIKCVTVSSVRCCQGSHFNPNFWSKVMFWLIFVDQGLYLASILHNQGNNLQDPISTPLYKTNGIDRSPPSRHVENFHVNFKGNWQIEWSVIPVYQNQSSALQIVPHNKYSPNIPLYPTLIVHYST